MNARPVRLAALALACTTFAACSSGTVASINPKPQPSLTKQQAAYEADAGMTATNAIRVASIAAAALKVTVGPSSPPAAIPCKDGVERQITSPSPGTIDGIVNVFYDRTCTHPFVKTTFTLVFTPPTAVLSAKQKTYDLLGKAVAYGKIAGRLRLAPGTTHAVLQGTVAKTPNGAPVASFGLTCLDVRGSNSCGFGAVTNIAPQGQAAGVTAGIKGFVASGSTTDGTVSLRAYTGRRGSLHLAQGHGNVWVVTGGTLVATQAGTFAETVDDKTFAVDVDLSMLDAIQAAGTAVALRSSGMKGAVAQTESGIAAARFSTLAAGIGSILYADGTTGRIEFFFVI